MPGNRVKNSKVWCHFQQKENGGICHHCKKPTFVTGKGGNTSNLLKHLRIHHRIDLNPCNLFKSAPINSTNTDLTIGKDAAAMPGEVPGPPLPELPVLEPDTSVGQTVKLLQHAAPPPPVVHQVTLDHYKKPKVSKMSEQQKSTISRAITQFIVKDMQPFSTIANEPFRKMIHALNPGYVPPNKETLSSLYVPSWYEVELQKLKVELSSVLGIGITADHWTSLNGDHYLTVTAQYVRNANWSLQSKVLSTTAVYESQTGEAIAAEIRNILNNYGIFNKTVAITVDNAANMAAGSRGLGILRIPCFAHSMNIAASKLYSEAALTKWLARLRTVVLWFKRVHMAGVVLKEKLRLLDLPDHTVILDVKTRWNSMYLMVERFVEIYPGLSAASRDQRLKTRLDKEKVDRVSDADLKKGEEFIETMKVLYTSTLAISTDKLPTAGQVLPTLNKLEKCFCVQEDDSEFKRMIKRTVWNDLQKRYHEQDVRQFLEEASALDPRFKNKINDTDVWKRIEEKVAEMIRMVTPPKVKVEPDSQPINKEETDMISTDCTQSQSDSADPSSNKENVPTLPNRKRSAIEELFGDDHDDVKITKVDGPPTPEILAHSQIEKYRLMPRLVFSENPLNFYEEHVDVFPMVSALAVKVLSVSGSSVPSERVFSLAGNTISQERVRINPEKADMLIFLHKNAE